MAKKQQNAINPSRAENYPEWYQQVIKAAELAEELLERTAESANKAVDAWWAGEPSDNEKDWFMLFLNDAPTEQPLVVYKDGNVENFGKWCAHIGYPLVGAGPPSKSDYDNHQTIFGISVD